MFNQIKQFFYSSSHTQSVSKSYSNKNIIDTQTAIVKIFDVKKYSGKK
ncbi:MAG: hypothetical protein Q8S84_08785 [bacterium]|nr:hypothetical protein [bacterium]